MTGGGVSARLPQKRRSISGSQHLVTSNISPYMADPNVFGAGGVVYRKDRTDENDAWLGRGKRKGGSGPSSQEPSRSSTPVHPPPHQRASGSSTMTSDLMGRPRSMPPPKQTNPPKSQVKQPEPAVSPAVKRILGLIESLQASSSSPAAKPCFCLARTHPLSPYTPLCIHCGLILCDLHPPAAPCPSCDEPLLTLSQRHALLSRLDQEMSSVLDHEEREERRKEEDERQRFLERSGGGAFPTLSGRPPPKPEPPQERKVITLGIGKKPPTMVAMHKVKPTSSVQPKKAAEPIEPEVERIPRPPNKIKLPPPTALAELENRPFLNLHMEPSERPVYIPEVSEVKKEGGEEKKKRRRRHGKGAKGEEGPTPKTEDSVAGPSAGPS